MTPNEKTESEAFNVPGAFRIETPARSGDGLSHPMTRSAPSLWKTRDTIGHAVRRNITRKRLRVLWSETCRRTLENRPIPR